MITKGLKIAGIVALSLCCVEGIYAQAIRYYSDISRVVGNLSSIESPGLFRSAFYVESGDRGPMEGSPNFVVLPAETFFSFNSDFPFGNNDGALWQGKGVNGVVRGGAELSWSWGRITMQPEWWFAQNLAFTKAPAYSETSKFGDYSADLDRLQAYGSQFYTRFNWGQSELRFQYAGFTLGFGTKNHKFGPAETQNLLLSDNASGFPMLDIGTNAPYRTAFGAFDARFFWGQTSTSEFYYNDGETKKRLVTGGLVSYSFPFLPGMSFGFQRVFHSPWDTMNAWKVFQFFDDTIWKRFRDKYPGGTGPDDDIDQILSLTWEWRVPQTGSRLYVEWGRNDHANDLYDFLMQPDHSQGYVAGIQQKMEFSENSIVLVTFEVADVGNTLGTILRPTGSWYRHSQTYGGYTNDGQLLGAYMGPGSNTQELNLYYLGGSFFFGFGLQRWIFDSDFFYTQSPINYLLYDMMLSGTVRSGVELEGIDIGVSATFTENYNRNFRIGKDYHNWHGEFSIKAKI
jgi:hypothetical protein